MPYFSGLEWVSGGHMPRCLAWVDKHFDGYYCLNYAASGAVRWRTGSRRFVTLRAPVAWWTFPGPRFQYGRIGDAPWDHYYVCFRGPRVQAYAEHGLLPLDGRRPWATVADPARFTGLFAELLALLEGKGHAPQRRIHHFEGLLLQLHEADGARPAGHRADRLAKLTDEIRRDPARAWSFPAEARKQGLSLVQFSRVFRRHAHMPPQRFLIRARIEAAARLLLESEQPLKQVAEAVGCPDIYYFSRRFRSHYGVPPGKYRREARPA